MRFIMSIGETTKIITNALKVASKILEKRANEISSFNAGAVGFRQYNAIEEAMSSIEEHIANIEVASTADSEEYEANKNDQGYFA